MTHDTKNEESMTYNAHARIGTGASKSVIRVTAQDPLFDLPTNPALKPAAGGPMPAWLVRLLETTTGGFRASRWDRCRSCGQLIIRGLDGDVAAFEATADPTPITEGQETLCARIGRWTYALTMNSRRIELDRRDKWSIGRPSPDRPIIPAHNCRGRFPGFLQPPAGPTPGAKNDGQPPF
jgi:hypothetical protein